MADDVTTGGNGAALALKDAADGRVYPVTDGYAIGRAYGDIVLVDQKGVSRRHGEFRIADGVVAFAQAEVRNPALLNGQAIASGCAAVVRVGDRLQFGARTFELVDAAAEASNQIKIVESPKAIETAGATEHVANEDELPFPEPGRGGALVTLCAFAVSAWGAWRTTLPIREAQGELEWRIALLAAICALAPLVAARAWWRSTLPRPETNPAWPALLLLAFVAGAEWAAPEWMDAATSAFSSAQADAIARSCGGETFRSGPCADMMETCGPRCRRMALPLLVRSGGDAKSPDPLAPKPPERVQEAAPEAPAKAPEAMKPAEETTTAIAQDADDESDDGDADGLAPSRAPLPSAASKPRVALAPKQKAAKTAAIPKRLPAKAATSRAFPEPPRAD